MTLSILTVTVDTTEPVPLARWWADQLGGEVKDPFGGFFVLVSGGPVQMAFQKVDDPTPGKNKVHVDLRADDLDAEVDRLLEAGAGLVGATRRRVVPLGDAHRPGRQPVLRRRGDHAEGEGASS